MDLKHEGGCRSGVAEPHSPQDGNSQPAVHNTPLSPAWGAALRRELAKIGRGFGVLAHRQGGKPKPLPPQTWKEWARRTVASWSRKVRAYKRSRTQN